MRHLSPRYCTDFLFVNPTFWIGAGSVFNLAGNYFSYNYSESSDMADYRALSSDWGNAGQDIEAALEKFLRDVGKKYMVSNENQSG